MEANAVGPKRILKSTDEAKSPHRILVRSLLKSRNKLREKYREHRAECKRWRNQAAAVERSRSTCASARWHTKQVPKRIEPRGPSSSPNCNNSGSNRSDGKWNQPSCCRAIGRPGRGGKKGVVNRLADSRQRAYPRPVGRSSRHASGTLDDCRSRVGNRQRTSQPATVLGGGGLSVRPRDPALRASSRTGTSQEVDSGVSGGWPLAGLVCCTGDPTGDQGQAAGPPHLKSQ